MKKILLIIGIVLLCIALFFVFLRICKNVLLTAMLFVSGGPDDWAYTLLPGDYEIWRVNSQTIVFGKVNASGSLQHVVDSYILEFSYNDIFIGLKQISLDSAIHYENEDILKTKPDAHFYLVDATQEIVYGPYTEAEYLQQLQTLHTGPLGEWISTIPRPEGATS